MRAKRTLIILTALIGTFLTLRGYLFLYPDSDFNIAGYNIHHLYSGIVIMMIGGIPLAIFQGSGRLLDLAAALFGVGLSMALDEWVYLVVTDGSNTSYLLPVSFWGGMIMVASASVYTVFLSCTSKKKKGNSQEV